MPEKKIGDILFKSNRFTTYSGLKLIEIDPDPNYSTKFLKKFKTSGNEVSKRCNCTNPELSTEGTEAKLKTEEINRNIFLESR